MTNDKQQKLLAIEMVKVASKIVPELAELTKGTQFVLSLVDDGEGFGIVVDIAGIPRVASMLIPELLRKDQTDRKPIEAEDIDPSTLLRIDEGEKELIQRALEKANDNRHKAAELLGLSERTLHRKIKEYGLNK